MPAFKPGDKITLTDRQLKGDVWPGGERGEGKKILELERDDGDDGDYGESVENFKEMAWLRNRIGRGRLIKKPWTPAMDIGIYARNCAL